MAHRKKSGFFSRIIAKIRREKKQEKRGKKPKKGAPFHGYLKIKKKGGIDEKKLKRLEKKIGEVAKKHNVAQKEIEEHVKKIETRKVISKAHELPKLEEIEKKVLKAAEPPAEEAKPEAKKEEVKAIALEIKKHRIVTDFDKILSTVQQKGKITMNELNKSLGIEKKRLEECCGILEESGLIELDYPALGSPKIESRDFGEKLAEEKKRRKEEKKKTKPAKK